MKKLNFKQKLMVSLTVLVITILAFIVMTFFVFKVPFQMDILFNEVVLALVVSLYAFFMIQYGSWVGIVIFILGMVASFWALAFSVERSGGNAIAFNGLFIWIIVMLSSNIIGLILDLVWKSKRKAKRIEKATKETLKQERLEAERLEAERELLASQTEKTPSIHLNDITVDEPLEDKENNVD
ncbi:hypothetical protein K0810_06135 [Erysipelothrix rhusiopathiae]|uniref:hypothetical protein n=2 Tax=Erysipelothrix rhusiopathiae TaxID=1648 RepID=UPI000210B5D0|nr:hypothetical protein [Erysipelothrix rhusiopathiae]UPU38863.1 hypothetical protein MX850_09795 [Erysipelothrix sp. Poltava]AMS10630.1 hypothetical protein A2I91_02285 [Erysipelothrix rhusiopathiae]AOO67028.1 hypothetical protein BC346_01430 [Erysipelothrix rhusiopathiae]AWU42011.1 hypothetical protein DM789_07245 [Erysipelothrix rhusiopathiae]MDE8165183.1 hypothetical protein [Erysipelothrix rhusiopathiae]